MTTPTQSGRASGSASRGMRTGSCDFIFGAAPLRQRSKIAQGIRGRTTSISSPPDKGARIRSPLIPLAVTSHCMNSSAAYEYAEPSGVTPSVFGSPSRSPKSKTRARGRVVEKVWKRSRNCTSSTGRATGDAHELSQRLDDASSRLHSLRGAPRYRLPETLEGAIIAQQPPEIGGMASKVQGWMPCPLRYPRRRLRIGARRVGSRRARQVRTFRLRT